MRKDDFRLFLNSEGLTENGSEFRLSKVKKGENYLNADYDDIVSNDIKMFNALNNLRKVDSKNAPLQNALRKYYHFAKGKEFPLLKDFHLTQLEWNIETIGLYLEKYSSSAELVAWENLHFVYGSKKNPVEHDIDKTIYWLFDIYRKAYFKREEERGNHVWKECFSMDSMYPYGVGMCVSRVPISNAYNFALSLLDEIAKIDSYEKYTDYLDNIGWEGCMYKNIYEVLNKSLPDASKFLKKYLEIVKTQGGCKKYADLCL